MRIETVPSTLVTTDGDAVIVGLFKDGALPKVTQLVDDASGGLVSRVLGEGAFRAGLGRARVVDAVAGLAAPRLLLTGLGEEAKFDLEASRRALASAVKVARQAGLRRLVAPDSLASERVPAPVSAQSLVEAAIMANYTFRAYKTRDAEADAEPEIESLALAVGDPALAGAVSQAATAGQAIAAGVCLARDLANHPANVATPSFLAAQAAELASRYSLRCEVWDRERILAEGMGALASVAQGSEEPPRFIILEYVGRGQDDEPPLVLVGKGLTFDAGGISLKPGLKMAVMKADMAGAAAVLGALQATASLRLPLHVYGLIPATENLPSGRATRPGDIVRARNGTTIEVLNTDAEGRMVLADALCYAADLNPRAVVDIATLTGAIVVALGHHAAGLFANDDGLAAELVAAGETTGERVWRMPLWEAYDELIKSEVADIKNAADTSPSPAGAVFGAKFLERFVGFPWAHLDIAGMFWDAPDVPYMPKGATGFGVRLLVAWLRGKA